VTITGGVGIIEVVDIKVSPHKRRELRRALASLSGPTEAEPGCASFHLYQPLANPNVVRVESHWKTESDFFRHIRSDAYKKFLMLLELGCEPPTVSFYKVSGLKGLGLVKVARDLWEETSGLLVTFRTPTASVSWFRESRVSMSRPLCVNGFLLLFFPS
jgi:quinol monooxygenase YgiN